MRLFLRAILVLTFVVGLSCHRTARAGTHGSPGQSLAGRVPFFDRFDLPDAWEARFWASPDAQALLAMEPEVIAQLVPAQAGLRYCRCPACGADESAEPLVWSVNTPQTVSCRLCTETFPNDSIPARINNVIPEEVVQVRPGTFHRYPYHVVDPAHQRLPDERLYLSARRDYEAREFLAKAALYAAVKHRQRPDPRLARLACTVILRFAQVYPGYAVHYDQPGQPKLLQAADLLPPYQRGYQTAKWDWSGCLEVPVNLVLAYALVRDDAAWGEIGPLLGCEEPALLIERDLFRASAQFSLRQPLEASELGLYVIRGLLAVGRLLGDESLVREATARFESFLRQGFFHDGLWRGGDSATHHRILTLIDGWIRPLAIGDDVHPAAVRIGTSATAPGQGVADPILELARRADAAISVPGEQTDVRLASWPASPARAGVRSSMLLGGSGLARLAVGTGPNSLELELRGLGDDGTAPTARLAIRVAAGGRPALGDLDDHPPMVDGFDRSTASHNSVLIDGLNHRETPTLARQGAPGANLLFFAADPDFQVALMGDPRAYPSSATRYRHLVLVSAGSRRRYGVSVFEVEGGLQHDQVFHAAVGTHARWQVPGPTEPGPNSLLAPSLTYVLGSRAEEGRWFVQALGAFRNLQRTRLDRPSLATLTGAGGTLRAHVLGDVPATAILGETPGPDLSGLQETRSSLVIRRTSDQGATLKSHFVTLFEPAGSPFPPLTRVGRVEAPPGTIVLLVESAEGVEHLVINLRPNVKQIVRLSDSRTLETDGLAVRIRGDGMVLAGGQFASQGEMRCALEPMRGSIHRTQPGVTSGGWFETDAELTDLNRLPGRTLLIRHGDGTSRGWTIERAMAGDHGGTRFLVHELPGFHIEPSTGEAVYDQHPGTRHPGPHTFGISRLAR